MAFADEIIKHQRQRSVYLDFSAVNNPGVDWEGEVTRLYGTAYDDLGEVPIKGTVTTFGTFARSVLNMELSLETPSVTVELTDHFNEWRVLAEPPSDLLVYRWVHLMIRVLDDNGGYFDHRVGVGQIIDPQFPAGKKVSLNISLSPGSFMGESLPRRLITLRDFPRCPPENVGKVVPVIYGVMSNTVRTVNTTPATPGATDVQCTDTQLFNENFESSPALSSVFGYVSNMETAAGVGNGGSVGMRQTSGSDTGLVHRQVSPSSLRGCCTFDYLALDTVGTFAVEGYVPVLNNASYSTANGIFSVFLGGSGYSPSLGISVILRDGTVAFSGAAGTLSSSVFRTIRVEWQVSTWDGSTLTTPGDIPDGYAQDGFIAIYVDDVNVYLGTGLSMGTGHYAAYTTPEFEWDTVHFETDGGGGARPVYDNILVRDGGSVPTLTDQTPATCTPSDTGTGPNMTSGAARAILVDTGITTAVTVQNPAPEPGGTTIDTSIEQMGTAFANERIGSGSINVPTYFYVAPMVGGNVGPLSSIMDLDQGFDPDYPAHDAVISWNDLTTTPDQWIVWMFTDSNFHPVSNPEPGARVKIINGTPYTDPDYPPANTYDYQVVFTSVDDGDAWEPFPPLPAGPTTGTAFSGYRYLLAGHYLHRVNEVYVRRPVAVPNPDDPASPLTLEMQVLQQEGTDYLQEVIEVNGNRYHTIRFFAAQQSDDCTQQYEVTANVEGIETNADGTGELITNGIEMVEHILLNWVFNDYRSSTGLYAPPGGRWFTDVPYAPGLLDHASFLAAYEAAFTFVVNGYLGAGMLVEQQSGESLVTDLMRSFGLDFYFDSTSISSPGNGSWAVKLFQPAEVVRASLTELRPDPPTEVGYIGINANTFSFRVSRESQRNVVPYFAGPMYGRTADSGTNEDGGYTVSGEVRDPESIARYGTIVNDPLYFPWTRDPETAYSVAYRFLVQVRYPPIFAECVTPLSAILTPPSYEVKVTHPDGSGLTGWSGRVCRVYRSDINFADMTVSLLLRDVDALVP